MLTTVARRDPDNIDSGEAARSVSGEASWFSFILKIGLTALAFGVVAYTVDLSAAWQRTVNQSAGLVILATAMLLIQILLGGLRWHLILRRLGTRPILMKSLRLYYFAVFFNSCLWGAVGGDVLRAWLVGRGDGDTKTAVNSVILDRVAALAGVGILVLVTTPLLLGRIGESWIILLPVALSVAGIVGIATVAQLDRIPAAWRQTRFVRLAWSLGGATRLVFLHPFGAMPVVGVAIAAQLAMSMAAYIVATSLGIGLTVLDCIVLMQPVALAAALPISVGGWGVREATMIFLLGLAGIPASAALALSVQLGLLSLFVALPGGVLWLMMRTKDNGVARTVQWPRWFHLSPDLSEMRTDDR